MKKEAQQDDLLFYVPIGTTQVCAALPAFSSSRAAHGGSNSCMGFQITFATLLQLQFLNVRKHRVQLILHGLAALLQDACPPVRFEHADALRSIAMHVHRGPRGSCLSGGGRQLCLKTCRQAARAAVKLTGTRASCLIWSCRQPLSCALLPAGGLLRLAYS